MSSEEMPPVAELPLCLPPFAEEEAELPDFAAPPATTSMEKLRELTFFPCMVALAPGSEKEPARTGINTYV